MKTKKNSLLCPICDSILNNSEELLVGELIRCSDCGSELEVVKNKNRLSLTLAPDIQEDWGE